MWTGQNLLCSGQGCGIRKPPAVDVKHGNNRQHSVGVTDAEVVYGSEQKRVQHHGPVSVHNSLRNSRGARCVTHAGGFVFIEIGIIKIAGSSVQEILVIIQP